MTQQIDLLDVAFVAIGIDAAFRDPTMSGYDGGQLELVGEVLAFVPLLDAHYQAHFKGDGFDGCWAYEVAEPFGQWCAEQIMAGQALTQIQAQQWLMTHAAAAQRRSA